MTGPCRRFQNSPELSAIERGLFRSGTGIRENVQGDSLILYEAENPIREIQFVCAEIHRLVKEKGYRYRDIAVVTGALPDYSGELARQFQQNGIPCFMDSKKSILSNPVVEMCIRDSCQTVNLSQVMY